MTEQTTPSRSYHIGAHAFTADRLPPALYVVPTPVGNLGDVTLRALQVLAAADVIYCEDTRVTHKLLDRYGIRNRLKPYHDHNAQESGKAILAAVAAGQSVALTSDAGTPLISDPGFPLLRDGLAQGLKVEALPGASALLPALQLSGLPTDRFCFLGFLPQKRGERVKVLEALATREETVIVYESPYRILETLDDMIPILGERRMSVSREISKLHEETLRGSASVIRATLGERPSIKGEFVVVVGGAEATTGEVTDDMIEAAITQALVTLPASKAAAQVAKTLEQPRDEIYARILKRKAGS